MRLARALPAVTAAGPEPGGGGGTPSEAPRARGGAEGRPPAAAGGARGAGRSRGAPGGAGSLRIFGRPRAVGAPGGAGWPGRLAAALPEP